MTGGNMNNYGVTEAESKAVTENKQPLTSLGAEKLQEATGGGQSERVSMLLAGRRKWSLMLFGRWRWR